MTYDEAILKIKDLGKFGCKPGLSRIKKILKLMGSPEKKLKCIHVAGTNGKGSVSYMLASILKENGYKTGLYISPSINDFTERISINGEYISKKDVCELLSYIESFESEFSGDFLTEFEVTTAMAFKYFNIKNCDFVILETGMGGRFDATNAIENPVCSVITGISIDHTKYLGNTIEKIASEKLGIVKGNSNLVLSPSCGNVVCKMAKDICEKMGSKLFVADEGLIKNFKTVSLNKSEFFYKNKKFEANLVGIHQKNNISTVLTALDIIKKNFKISDEKINIGFKNVKIPCRIETISESPLIILDVSHNPESVCALKNFIKENLENKNLIAFFGMYADKDADTSLKIIGEYFKKIIVVEPENKRAMKLSKLEKIARKYNKNVLPCENFESGLKNTVKNLSGNDALIIFGSFSVVGPAKKIIFSA